MLSVRKGEIEMEEEEEKKKSLRGIHIIGINNNTLTPDIIDDIWCEEDDTL